MRLSQMSYSTGTKCWVAIAIYLLYGLHFFPSDAANSADAHVPQAPRYLLVGQRSHPGKGTREDKGPLGSGRPYFALF